MEDLGETRLYAPSDRHGSSAFAVGMLQDIGKKPLVLSRELSRPCRSRRRPHPPARAPGAPALSTPAPAAPSVHFSDASVGRADEEGMQDVVRHNDHVGSRHATSARACCTSTRPEASRS